jgi:hypothetical protein
MSSFQPFSDLVLREYFSQKIEQENFDVNIILGKNCAALMQDRLLPSVDGLTLTRKICENSYNIEELTKNLQQARQNSTNLRDTKFLRTTLPRSKRG